MAADGRALLKWNNEAPCWAPLRSVLGAPHTYVRLAFPQPGCYGMFAPRHLHR